MKPDEAVVVIDPFPAEAEKFKTTLVERRRLDGDRRGGGGDDVSDDPHPAGGRFSDGVLQLLAGWNILVQVGVALGIHLDKAERARKIGNEFIAR